MSDTFTEQERKEVITRLLKVEKFQDYSLNQKVDLVKLHFALFSKQSDTQVKNYLLENIQDLV